jgi:hypothetical protein
VERHQTRISELFRAETAICDQMVTGNQDEGQGAVVQAGSFEKNQQDGEQAQQQAVFGDQQGFIHNGPSMELNGVDGK